MGLKLRDKHGEFTVAAQAIAVAGLVALCGGGLTAAYVTAERKDYRAEAMARAALTEKRDNEKLVGTLARRLNSWN